GGTGGLCSTQTWLLRHETILLFTHDITLVTRYPAKKPFGAQRLRRNRASGYVEPGDSRERGSRHGIHPNNAPNTRFSTSERK
ncbi:hypothetical protein ACMZZG_24840, partial [Pseudocitrobacter faecalis]